MVPWESFTFVTSRIQCKKQFFEIQGQGQFYGRFFTHHRIESYLHEIEVCRIHLWQPRANFSFQPVHICIRVAQSRWISKLAASRRIHASIDFALAAANYRGAFANEPCTYRCSIDFPLSDARRVKKCRRSAVTTDEKQRRQRASWTTPAIHNRETKDKNERIQHDGHEVLCIIASVHFNGRSAFIPEIVKRERERCSQSKKRERESYRMTIISLNKMFLITSKFWLLYSEEENWTRIFDVNDVLSSARYKCRILKKKKKKQICSILQDVLVFQKKISWLCYRHHSAKYKLFFRQGQFYIFYNSNKKSPIF